MKLAAPPTELTSSLRLLAKNLRRLQPEQGRRARKNAREKVLATLRLLRSHLDTFFPPVAKAPPANVVFRPRGERTPAQVYATFKGKMERRDYGPVTNTHLALVIAKAGVRLIDPPKRTAVTVPYAPNWAIAGATQGSVPGGMYNVEKVRELKKSVTARKAMLGAVRLGAV